MWYDLRMFLLYKFFICRCVNVCRISQNGSVKCFTGFVTFMVNVNLACFIRWWTLEFFFILFFKYITQLPDPPSKKTALALSCELFPLAFLPLEHLPAAQISCVSGLKKMETSLPWLFLKTNRRSLSCHCCLPCGGTGQNWATSMSHISHTPAEPPYLFDEGCCLQAAFTISHLILELLPQLLEVVCLPQNVVLACGVLLAELQAPPHHFCTYGPVWIALCFKSLAQGQETCQHSSFPTSQQRRVSPTLCHSRVACISKSPMTYLFTISLFTLIFLGQEKKVRKTETSDTLFCPSNVS